MSFGIEKQPGVYRTGRVLTKTTTDLDKARVFTRKIDAINSGGTNETIKTVTLVLAQ